MRNAKLLLFAASVLVVFANVSSATAPFYAVEPDGSVGEAWIVGSYAYVGNYTVPEHPTWWWLAESFTPTDASYLLSDVSVYAFGPGKLKVRMSEGDNPGDLGGSDLLGTWSGPSASAAWRNISLGSNVLLDEGRTYWFWYTSQDTEGDPAPISVPYFYDDAIVSTDFPEPLDCHPTSDGSSLEWQNLHGDEVGYGLRLYAAPEPVTLALLGVFGGAAVLARKRKARA